MRMPHWSANQPMNSGMMAPPTMAMTMKEGVNKEEAGKIKKVLEDNGAKVEIK